MSKNKSFLQSLQVHKSTCSTDAFILKLNKNNQILIDALKSAYSDINSNKIWADTILLNFNELKETFSKNESEKDLYKNLIKAIQHTIQNADVLTILSSKSKNKIAETLEEIKSSNKTMDAHFLEDQNNKLILTLKTAYDNIKSVNSWTSTTLAEFDDLGNLDVFSLPIAHKKTLLSNLKNIRLLQSISEQSKNKISKIFDEVGIKNCNSQTYVQE